MRFSRAIPVCLLALPAVWAGPAGNDLLTEKDLKPYRAERTRLEGLIREKKIQVVEAMGKLRTRTLQEKDPRKRALWHFIYGSVRMDWLEQNKDAEREFKEALKLYDRFPACYGRLAVLAFTGGDRKYAHKLINRALELDPGYVTALLFKAQLYVFEKKYFKALKLRKRAFEIEVSPATSIALAQVYVQLWQDTFNDREKKEYAGNAEQYAQILLALDTKSGQAQIILAEVYVETGQVGKGIQTLEAAVRSQIPESVKRRAFSQLFMLHLRSNQIEKAIHALERQQELLPPGKQRDDVAKRIKDLKEKGGFAYASWIYEGEMRRLANPGVTAIERRDAVRKLLNVLRDPQLRQRKEFLELRTNIFRAIIKALRQAPPEVSVEILRWFQKDFRDPLLMRVLVHFIYPNDDKFRTPAVRLEAIRTIAEVGGIAALPTLYYCLRDEPGEVLRAVETSLARICEIRSLVNDELAPLNREQKKIARIRWRRYFTSQEGAEKMVEAIKALPGFVDMDPSFNRSQKTKPMADHVMWTLLLDDDIPYLAWRAAYDFMRRYLDREFRPISRRGKPVTAAERPGIVREIESFMGGGRAGLPPARDSGGTQSGDSKKKKKKGDEAAGD